MDTFLTCWTVLAIIALSCFLWVALLLIGPIISPSVLTYPWNEQETEERTVILAGSYNPPHFGHLTMLEYLSKRYRKVVAVVGYNPNKEYAVLPQERADLLRDMLLKANLAQNVRVEVVEGYIWRYAKRIGATIFVRGIRSWDKDGSDERVLQILNTWGPLLLGPLVWPIPTLYLEGDPKYNHVSSSLIRELCAQRDEDQRALNKLIPADATERVISLYCKKKE